MEPGQSKSVTLSTSKTLANTDEIELNNDTELTEIKRTTTTGRIPDITNSNVYDRGETVIITPPTGDNQNYIIPIIIGVTALIILGAGVVVIKKKVIK
jgi:LPXTG-motif cell wall-anchored protein